jgi:FlaA1/EpsC-like NDP-sugar epimerase
VGFPRSVLIIDWILSLFMVGGLRFTFRLLAENRTSSAALRSNGRSGTTQNALIVGAGDAGAMVVRELQKNPQLNITPVGFLDDNPGKLRQQIYGVPIVGTLTDMARVLDSHHVDQVIIAIPSAPGRVVRMVADVCRLKNVPFRTMPGIYELLGGQVSVNRLREVNISDLLRREPVRVQEDLIGKSLRGKVILVTGAGGSIGRELCRQIARWGPSELILLGHGENSIFEALQEMKETYSSMIIRPVIADVRDNSRLEMVFANLKPEIVFHAAAHKHVPMMEWNVEEAVTNNILGTRNVVSVARNNNVGKLIMISTDKAIKPANVMGATKRIAEMIVLNASDVLHAFSVVRFGNVLGSRGSVVPLFNRQIARGGPVTITHPDMKRYFMTIPEAVHLVLQAAAMGKGGETFVLNMGQQVRILDLAEDLIRLSGLEPGKDIEIVFTGIRPGEKLSEDLWDPEHIYQSTGHPDVFCLDGDIDTIQSEQLEMVVNQLLHLARQGEVQSILSLLDTVLPNASVCSTPPPHINAID